LAKVNSPWAAGLMMRATIGPREAQSGNSGATKFMVRSSPLWTKRLTVTGFGIEMALGCSLVGHLPDPSAPSGR
jgi:hypothetical protein